MRRRQETYSGYRLAAIIRDHALELAYELLQRQPCAHVPFLLLTAILYRASVGGPWELLLVGAAALHFGLAYRLFRIAKDDPDASVPLGRCSAILFCVGHPQSRSYPLCARGAVRMRTRSGLVSMGCRSTLGR